MDIRDFENNFKYKLILPIIYVTNWILMVTGPFFFPVGYQKYYFVTIAYLTVRSIMTFLWTVVGSYKAYCLLNKYEEKGKFTQVQLEESKNERKERLLKK